MIVEEMARRWRIDGRVRVDIASENRTFVVGAKDIRIVVSGGRTRKAWQAALHEVGHALVALAGLRPVRAVDEAVATWASDRLARADQAMWMLGVSPDEAARRAREAEAGRALRRRSAALLVRFERDLYREPGGDLAARWHAAAAAAGWTRTFARPPAALWHDPGAQAAYRAAEELALRLGEALAAGAGLAEAVAGLGDRA